MILLTLALLLAPSETFEATAYHLHGRTATGHRPGPGTVAADPRVIPLGSRVWVSGYGHAVARDTGRAIRGRRVDVWLPSRHACRRWGRRRVQVRVIRAPRGPTTRREKHA